MLKIYRDHNGHVGCVHHTANNQTVGLINKAQGIQRFTIPTHMFERQFKHSLGVASRKSLLSWYGRALSKRGNDPLALNLLKEIIMEKALDEMTMDEVLEAYNELATEMGKPNVDTFKSLKAARAALVKLQNPPVPKAPRENTGNETRGPVQGIGAFCKGLLLEGQSNKDVLEAALANFPSAKTTMSCVSYYRSKLVLAGKLERTAKGQARMDAAAVAE